MGHRVAASPATDRIPTGGSSRTTPLRVDRTVGDAQRTNHTSDKHLPTKTQKFARKVIVDAEARKEAILGLGTYLRVHDKLYAVIVGLLSGSLGFLFGRQLSQN